MFGDCGYNSSTAYPPRRPNGPSGGGTDELPCDDTSALSRQKKGRAAVYSFGMDRAAVRFRFSPIISRRARGGDPARSSLGAVAPRAAPPLAPVPRGEGRGEGPNAKVRISPVGPSPYPSPLRTGERGPEPLNAARREAR